MSIMQDEDIKRWTAKRKSALALALGIVQGKATIVGSSSHGFKSSALDM